MPTTKNKYAVLHAFFRPKGGGEKLVFNLRNHLNADLYTGAIDKHIWDKSKSDTDSFIGELYNPHYQFTYLHEDVRVPILRKMVRQWQLRTNKTILQLNNYTYVFFSGNIAGVGGRLDKKVKKIMYVHTPPRPFTDQLKNRLEKTPGILRPAYKIFAKWVVSEYRKELETMDVIVSNSENIRTRLKKFVGVDSTVIYPPINTKKFNWLGQKDYYLSYARLEDMKRIKLVVEAFASQPDKKLVICSSGPLKDWIKNQIKTRNLTNITFEGLVTDERLYELVGNCIAGIYIPVDEDAGIIQCELMAAGKPVLGVNEGGLKETIINGKTGVLIKENPELSDLMEGLNELTPTVAKKMKNNCIKQAEKFDEAVFYKKIDEIIEKLD